MQWNMPRDFIQPREGAKYRRIHVNDRHHSPDTMIPLSEMFRTGESIGAYSKLLAAGGLVGGESRERYRVPSGGDKNVLEFNSSDGCVQVVSMPLTCIF